MLAPVISGNHVIVSGTGDNDAATVVAPTFGANQWARIACSLGPDYSEAGVAIHLVDLNNVMLFIYTVNGMPYGPGVFGSIVGPAIQMYFLEGGTPRFLGEVSTPTASGTHVVYGVNIARQLQLWFDGVRIFNVDDSAHTALGLAAAPGFTIHRATAGTETIGDDFAAGDFVAATPTLSSLSPSSAAAGATITLTGTNFVTDATMVTISGTGYPVTVVSPTSGTSVVPALAPATVSVTCTTPGGTSSTQSLTITAAAAPTLRKGTSIIWRETYTDADLALLKVSWWYDWGNYSYADAVNVPGADGIPWSQTVTPNYVPMCWGDWEDTSQWFHGASPALSQSIHAADTMLGFNEPDNADQANMSVSRALALWPQLVATGCRLGSPAPSGTNGGTVGLAWLASFMSGNGGAAPKVDFICAHWYKDYDYGYPNIGDYLDFLHTTYGKPIWLTEVGDLSEGISANAALMPTVMSALATRPWVERVAWFTNRDSGGWPGAYMIDSGGTLNAAGTQYATYPPGPIAVTATRTTTWNVAAAPFTPASIANCGIWLDANDASTFTFSSGSTVSAWRDKSGNGRHTQTAAASPVRGTVNLNGLPTVSFNGVAQVYTNNPGSYLTGTGCDCGGSRADHR